jgi:hypothetical protein
MAARPTTVVGVVLGLVVAALAGFAVGRSIDEDAGSDDCRALVAEQTIAKGVEADEIIESGLAAESTLPCNLEPDSSLTELADLEGRIALVDIPAGSVLVRESLAYAGAINTRVSDTSD